MCDEIDCVSDSLGLVQHTCEKAWRSLEEGSQVAELPIIKDPEIKSMNDEMDDHATQERRWCTLEEDPDDRSNDSFSTDGGPGPKYWALITEDSHACYDQCPGCRDLIDDLKHRLACAQELLNEANEAAKTITSY